MKHSVAIFVVTVHIAVTVDKTLKRIERASGMRMSLSASKWQFNVLREAHCSLHVAYGNTTTLTLYRGDSWIAPHVWTPDTVSFLVLDR